MVIAPDIIQTRQLLPPRRTITRAQPHTTRVLLHQMHQLSSVTTNVSSCALLPIFSAKISDAFFAWLRSADTIQPTQRAPSPIPEWPPPVEEPRRRNWYAIYDPALDPKRAKGKDVIYRYDGKAPYGEPEIVVQDPRLEPRAQGKDLSARGVRKFRPLLYPLTYEVRVVSLALAHLVHQPFHSGMSVQLAHLPHLRSWSPVSTRSHLTHKSAATLPNTARSSLLTASRTNTLVHRWELSGSTTVTTSSQSMSLKRKMGSVSGWAGRDKSSRSSLTRPSRKNVNNESMLRLLGAKRYRRPSRCVRLLILYWGPRPRPHLHPLQRVPCRR